ncbi:serine/threonine protein phosphatase 1 [Cyclonatronum proteinivorum]|uniref:Serine/threonine protein phosphatase 1 n=1 Tax=Cyclonatronum proteinivorum TaxID=1457365 RepID=A0A345ULR7_9BACT|nr:metallophosphoesterase family protein [Cyclonatronum proteinivorum]AXJ01419.1 serine/threonine protein phosphatase 1 [Cyclonatronum proteinivorum]
MRSEKIIAIGDIHGCPKSLAALLGKLSAYSGATYVFLGDYIDRGPDSKGVIDLLMAFQTKEKCVFLRGNHEEMMLQAAIDGDSKMWTVNGGDRTLKSFGFRRWPEDFLASHYYPFINETLMYYDTEAFMFVHAGMNPHVSIQTNFEWDNVDNFLWERSHVREKEIEWEKPVVFGHTPMRVPMNEPLKIGIDTGCCYAYHRHYGKLTAVVLPDRIFIQQPYIDTNL